MHHWTPDEDRLLRKYAHKGPDAVSREIRRQLGINRTKYAVQCHASRIGVSLMVVGLLVECPECHREFGRLVPSTGMCRECTIRDTNRRLKERKRKAQENHADTHSPAVKAIERENAALRKWLATH